MRKKKKKQKKNKKESGKKKIYIKKNVRLEKTVDKSWEKKRSSRLTFSCLSLSVNIANSPPYFSCLFYLKRSSSEVPGSPCRSMCESVAPGDRSTLAALECGDESCE